MSKSVATIVGGAAGALALMAVFVGLVWFCKSQCKNVSNKNSETGSSDPSALGKSSVYKDKEASGGCSCHSVCSLINFITLQLSGIEGLDQFQPQASLYLEPMEHGSSQWQSWSKPPGHLVKVVSLAMEALVQYTKACFSIL